MNVTGRIALFVNLALSLVFAFWGVAIYANRVDWSNQRTGETAGEYARRDETVKNLRDTVLPKAIAHWSTLSPVVSQLEDRQPKLQDWYAKDLENLRAGMN